MTDTQTAYREVIADLKSRRDAIDQLIGELEALVGGQGPLRGMTVVEAAKAVLRENGKPMSPAAITERIKAGGCEVSSANTVASILHRYAKDNEDIFSPERGLWSILFDTDQDEPTPGGLALAHGLESSLPQVPSGPALDIADVVKSIQSMQSSLPHIPSILVPHIPSIPVPGVSNVVKDVVSGLSSVSPAPTGKTRKRRS